MPEGRYVFFIGRKLLYFSGQDFNAHEAQASGSREAKGYSGAEH